ncbi:MAG: GntP family permease, partial [Endozoicomonas sp.]
MPPLLTMLIGFIGSVALLVLLTVRWQWPAFLALLLASYFAGICFGFQPGKVASMVMEGFGSTLGDIGLTIALGALLGAILEHCGATEAIARGVINRLNNRYPALALAIIGYIVSIPIYSDSGFVILNSVRSYLARKHQVSPVFLSTVLGCSLYATHTLVPPTPGPLAAVANLQLSQQLSLVLISGLLISVMAVLAGFAWALTTRHQMPQKEQTATTEQDPLPIHFIPAVTPILVPI